MRRDEVTQIAPATPGWYAYGKDGGGEEFLSPVACWALGESNSGVRYVVGMCAHRQGSVEAATDMAGFVEYRYLPEEAGA